MPCRREIPGDPYLQPGERFRGMDPQEQFRLADNMAQELATLPGELVQLVLEQLQGAEPRWRMLVEERMAYYRGE